MGLELEFSRGDLLKVHIDCQPDSSESPWKQTSGHIYIKNHLHWVIEVGRLEDIPHTQMCTAHLLLAQTEYKGKNELITGTH